MHLSTRSPRASDRRPHRERDDRNSRSDTREDEDSGIYQMDSMWLSINDVRSTEVDYGNDEEVELMKKVMGFCEFDTTKVIAVSSLCFGLWQATYFDVYMKMVLLECVYLVVSLACPTDHTSLHVQQTF